MSLKEFITLMSAMTAIFFIGWFVSFSIDPYRVCIDHPDKAKRDDFFLCKPFDFELHKDTLLRRDQTMPWEKDGTFFDASKKRKKKVEPPSKLQRCITETKMQDPQNLMGIDVEKHCQALLDEREESGNDLNPSRGLINDEERMRPFDGAKDL